MADSFNGSIAVVLNATLSGDSDIGTSSHTINQNYKTTFTSGTGANQANQMWADTRTIAASGADDLDLAGGITNALGTTITFTSIKGIIVSAAAANTNDVQIGGDATAALAELFAHSSDIINVKPGGTFAIVNPNANGYAVTATTADILQITNSSSGTGVTYDIIIVGETA